MNTKSGRPLARASRADAGASSSATGSASKITSPAPTSTEGVYAVDRALAIVAAVEQSAAPMTLADLARATGLYKSTLLRLLISLDRAGLIERRADQRYVLGQFAFRLGRAYEATHHLNELIFPELEWLIEQGGESASFHVINDSQTRLCMFRIDSKHSTLDSIRAGDLLPMDRGAPGKVLLGAASLGTMKSVASLVETSFGERDPSCAAVAAPVFGPDGGVLGALSLSGPAERFTTAAVKAMTRMILVAAERATRAINGPWPASAATRRP